MRNKILLLFIGLSLSFGSVTAQVVMTRSTFTAPYTPITVGGGATASTAIGDNQFQDLVPLGFTFNYLGTNYTTVGFSTNGIAAFGGLTGSFSNIDFYTTTGPNRVLAAWWD